jgi:hypothetical protein
MKTRKGLKTIHPQAGGMAQIVKDLQCPEFKPVLEKKEKRKKKFTFQDPNLQGSLRSSHLVPPSGYIRPPSINSSLKCVTFF